MTRHKIHGALEFLNMHKYILTLLVLLSLVMPALGDVSTRAVVTDPFNILTGTSSTLFLDNKLSLEAALSSSSLTISNTSIGDWPTADGINLFSLSANGIRAQSRNGQAGKFVQVGWDNPTTDVPVVRIWSGLGNGHPTSPILEINDTDPDTVRPLIRTRGAGTEDIYIKNKYGNDTFPITVLSPGTITVDTQYPEIVLIGSATYSTPATFNVSETISAMPTGYATYVSITAMGACTVHWNSTTNVYFSIPHTGADILVTNFCFRVKYMNGYVFVIP